MTDYPQAELRLGELRLGAISANTIKVYIGKHRFCIGHGPKDLAFSKELVKRWNAHEVLVNACEQALITEELRRGCILPSQTFRPYPNEIVDGMTAALAEIKPC